MPEEFYLSVCILSMNAIIYKMSHEEQTYTIMDLFTLIQKRQFKKTESILLSMIEDMVTRDYNSDSDRQELVETMKNIYHNFNAMYIEWLSGTQNTSTDEFYNLVSHNHDNILVAHCTDAESMDDLLYETIEFLSDSRNNEAQYHLACYKRLIT